MKKIVSLLIIVCSIYSVSAKKLKTTVVTDTTVVFNESVTYKVAQDKQNLHISISTADNDMIMTMLRLGITVFFDVKGKENEDVYIKYPLEPAIPKFNREEASIDGFQTLEEEKKRKQQIATFIENDLPKEAEYKYYDSQQQFHILLNSLDATIAYTFIEEKGLLEYRIKIPKNRISANSKEDFSKLAIGVKTGKLKDLKSKRDDRSKGSGSNMRGGGSSSGGRGGRSGGSGGRGGQNNGEMPEGQNKQQAMAGIDFWFTVQNQ
jgi:uncharacterized membrane protein YgcG